VALREYVDNVYVPVVMPLMASSTQARYQSVIGKYLGPAFGEACLRDIGSMTVQKYFSGLSTKHVSDGVGSRKAGFRNNRHQYRWRAVGLAHIGIPLHTEIRQGPPSE